MNTKALLMLVAFLMISLNCFTQGFGNKFGLGITDPKSFANRTQSDLNRNSITFIVFNSVYIPSAGIGNSGNVLYKHKEVTGGDTSAMAIDIINETGIVILSNVSGSGKKAGNIDTLCFDLLTTIPKHNTSPTKCRK